MDDQKHFTDIIETLKYPTCPKCGSKHVALGRVHSACLEDCRWMGPTVQATNGNIIIKSIIAQESYLNLTSNSENSIKWMLEKMAKEKDFPGANEVKKLEESGSARCFVPKFDDFGEAIDIGKYFCERSIKTFKLSTFSFMERIASVMAHSMYVEKIDNRRRVSTTIASALKGIFNEPGVFLFDEAGNPSKYFFRKKAVVDLDSNLSTPENTIVKVYSASFGRPDTTLEAKYSPVGGFLENEYPKYSISDKAMIWQPFYWPSIKTDNSETIRLIAVLQGGNDNLNYVVTESMDSGTFRAGVYKRSIYEPGFEYIPSKATDVEDAIRRLRTSFEKTVLRHSESGDELDFSWIKDWNYDSTPDNSFHEVMSAPFWQDAAMAEMFHLLGKTKEDILEEMYQDIEKIGI